MVLVRRTRGRGLTAHADVATGLQRLAQQYGLGFQEFSDNPVPSWTDTMGIFRRARLIVAPHGAGLSNLIYAEPGAFVIEALCEQVILEKEKREGTTKERRRKKGKKKTGKERRRKKGKKKK